MPDKRFIVLLNDALMSYLLGTGEAERRRIREKFEFLENGFWDAGVRVKKLKGTAGRVVFEARLSKGDRLLFTLGNHRGDVAVYIWGLVRHDAISAEARRIVPRNAPFLDFEPLESEERPDLSVQSLSADAFSQEDVEERVPEDYGPQKWLVLDDAEWQRLLAGPDSSAFEAFLFLTREQEELLAASPPILLSGTAGSGKTTLSVYYLLRGAMRGRERLFVTYNPLLRRLAERIYAGLVEKRPLPKPEKRPRFALFRELLTELTGGMEGRFPPDREVGLREFERIFADHKDRRKYDAELIWQELRSIIKGTKLPLNATRLEGLVARFASRQIAPSERAELVEYLAGLQGLALAGKTEQLIAGHTSFGTYAGFLRAVASSSPEVMDRCSTVLDDLARRVRKSAADFDSPLISLEEYLALGKKRAPDFLYDRREIYAIAEFYQDRIARSGQWDELDLSKAALRLLDGSARKFSYDLVVCDEVQDLTDIQVSLLFRLAASPRAMVLTGDPRQIINPSGFRWEEVKNKFYERDLPVPRVHRLSLNFRSVGPIVRLSNALLDLKQRALGVADTDTREEWKFGGRPPLLVTGLADDELLERIRERGAGHAVLTRTPEECRRLKQALATELVFTISEAKGLEFDTVLLWKFCREPETEAIWQALLQNQPLSPERSPHVRHELAMLYVAVTRARNTLIIYDGEEASAVWMVDPLGPLVFRTAEKGKLAELWSSVSTPAEWEAQGDYYLEHEQLAAARECYRNSYAEGKLELAEARLCERDGDFARAAPLFERQGRQREAAECYERARAWQEAERLWKMLGERGREGASAARGHEDRREFKEAAEAWEALGDGARALSNWERAGLPDRLARAYAALGHVEKAAALFEKARLPRDAAANWEKAGHHARAADLYFRAGDFRQAARAYRACGDMGKLAACCRQLGDDHGAALAYEAGGEVRRAIAAFSQFAAASEENRVKLLADISEGNARASSLKAAIRYSALAMPDKAAPLFLQAGASEQAAEEYGRMGDHAGMARSLERAGRFLEAARSLEETDADDHWKADEILRLLGEHYVPGTAGEPRALKTEAEKLLEEGRTVAALARFRLVGDQEGCSRAYARLGWHREALVGFLAASSFEAATHYLRDNLSNPAPGLLDSILDGVQALLQPGGTTTKQVNDFLAELTLRTVSGTSAEESSRLVEKFFSVVFASLIFDADLARESEELLLRPGAGGYLVRYLRLNFLESSRAGKRLRDFLDRLARAAEETSDPLLAACAAYIADIHEFERIAAVIPLTDQSAVILGMSKARYREAAAHLMAGGRTDEAMSACGVHRDHLLLASYAEKGGRIADAMDAFEKAGATGHVERLKKKYPRSGKSTPEA